MKLIKSFGYAWAGIKSCFQSEPNLKIHSALTIVALIFSIVFNISAIEKLCDVVHKEMHPGIKKVKDMAAGAVLVAAFFSMITGAVIFLPKIISLIKSIL